MYDRKIKPGGTVEERSLAIRQRSVEKRFLDAEPLAGPPSLAEVLTTEARKEAQKRFDLLIDEAHRENQHRDFLAGKPTVTEIRDYLYKGSYRVFGSFEFGTEEQIREYGKSLDQESEKIVELFKELLGTEEPFCEHAKTWLESCPYCNLITGLIAKGHDPSFVNEWYCGVDGWLKTGETFKAWEARLRAQSNVALRVLGLYMPKVGVWEWGGRRTRLLSIGGFKELDRKDGVQESRESTTGGGKKATKGLGPDQDERNEGDVADDGLYIDKEKPFDPSDRAIDTRRKPAGLLDKVAGVTEPEESEESENVIENLRNELLEDLPLDEGDEE